MGLSWRWDRAPSERRSNARRQPALGTVCRLAASDGTDLGMGLVWNLSARGVSLLLGKRIEAGLHVRIDLINAGGTVVTRGLRVAHAAPLETGDFALGGQFDQELLPEEMGQFLTP